MNLFRIILLASFFCLTISAVGCDCGTKPPPLPDGFEFGGDGGVGKDSYTDSTDSSEQADEPVVENPDLEITDKKERIPETPIKEVQIEPDKPLDCTFHPQYGESCEVGIGECVTVGRRTICDGKGGVKCDAKAREPTPEVCDGVDNNCDGQIDNGLTAPLCNNQNGVCKGLRQTCAGDRGWLPCTPEDFKAKAPGFEEKETKCDGQDNDCDGQVDNLSNAPKCAKQLGVCKGSVQKCNGSLGWQVCDASIYTAYSKDYQPLETKCDQLDNDCDGSVDLGCKCTPGTSRPCGDHKTAPCKQGTQACNQAGQWELCQRAINPKTEICDGIDNDCNGQVDDNLQPPLCKNQAGSCKGSKASVCEGMNGWKKCSATDFAKDTDFEQTETKCDGKDNDCNGKIDDITTPPLCKLQSGVCRGARRICSGTSGWTTCAAAVYAAHSVDYSVRENACDGKDNDCNGKVDDIATAPSCANQNGVCKGAKRTCLGEKGWAQCSDQTFAQHSSAFQTAEVKCDKLDNDCDGTIDEGCGGCTPQDTRKCGAHTTAPCKQGTQTCLANGTWDACKGSITPTTETCDGIDNDCNGKIDDIAQTNYQRCTKQKGVCTNALKRCDGKNGWAACTAADYGNHSQNYEQSETRCDGVDNDCDGQIDNIASPPSCAKQSGACKGSVKTCNGKQGWAACTITDYQRQSPSYEQSETSCDGIDNDCNGQIDDIAAKPLCAKQTGVCQGARKSCKGIQGWAPCTATEYTSNSSDFQASETKCDNKDNDCNGSTDEGCGGCTPGTKRSCGTHSTPPCTLGTQTCLSDKTWGSCTGAVVPKQETCNGIDDDCNGQIDDIPATAFPLCPRQKGVCKGSRKICVNGQTGLCTTATYQAHSTAYQVNETKCDNLDNDCDGVTDENCSP